MNWNEKFEIAKVYYEHHGELRVSIGFKTKDGYTYDSEGFELGIWINRQRHQHKIKELTKEHYEKLKSIGMVFGDLGTLDWENFYNLALIYIDYYGELPVNKDFRTKDGYTYNKDGKSLGAWFNMQRFNYNHKKLSEERMQKIGNLFERFNKIEKERKDKEKIEWEVMYRLASAYYQHYGHLNIPVKFMTINGYEHDKKGKALGEWIRLQREAYKSDTLTSEQIKRLENINLVFLNVISSEWERMYKLAQIYYQHHGHLKVPRQFCTKNGYEYDKDGSKLGKWLNTQYSRKHDGYISKEEYEKLKEIGMNFENQKEAYWNKMYELAQKYYEHYKNLKVPVDFKTKNGYEYDEEGERLGFWLNCQRKNFLAGNISKEHIEKLREIGMVFENLKDARWERMYKLAKIYYQHYHNLKINTQFKTKNGYEYDEEGEKLGAWLSSQRRLYKYGQLLAERVEKLEVIGIIFEKKEDKIKKQDACMKCGIDYSKYKEQIDVIPHREFISKINYLNAQQMPIILNDQLHPIFFISSVNMEVRYGINLEQLITEYQPSIKKVKRG